MFEQPGPDEKGKFCSGGDTISQIWLKMRTYNSELQTTSLERKWTSALILLKKQYKVICQWCNGTDDDDNDDDDDDDDDDDE